MDKPPNFIESCIYYFIFRLLFIIYLYFLIAWFWTFPFNVNLSLFSTDYVQIFLQDVNFKKKRVSMHTLAKPISTNIFLDEVMDLLIMIYP